MIGKIYHTLKWGLKHTRDGVERTLSPSEFREINDRTSIPSWIQADENSVYFGFDPRFSNEYFSVRKSFERPQLFPSIDDPSSEQSISIYPPEQFTGVDFHLLDVQNTESVKIQATFTHPDGAKTEDSVKYELQDFPLHEGNVLPIDFTVPEPAIEATFDLNTNRKSKKHNISNIIPERFRRWNWKPDPSPRLSVPAPRGSEGTPIFLISVDTFRHDALKEFEPLLNILGEDAVIPDEPRTQGHWTRPAHASMFTGVHPGTHGYVGTAGQDEGGYGIPPHLTTIPELLSENLYKCSGCVPRPKTGIEYGFGRGMHRYAYKPVSWLETHYDGSDSVDQVIQWLDRDVRENSDRLFYFLHLFDSHYPYFPTAYSDASSMDLNLLDEFNSLMGIEDYLETLDDPASMPGDDIKSIKSYYHRAVEYVAEQIIRLVQHLKSIGLYEDGLIIITGDHGEDFLEREFAGHNSVTDANIRPGMIVKPPANSDMEVPDNADLIDLLPTIAEVVGEDLPNQCEGISWYDKSDIPRITERIQSDYYTISAEIESTKAVHTYEENWPHRPTKSQIEEGPKNARYFDTSTRSPGDPLNETEPPTSLKEKLDRIIKEHTTKQIKQEPGRNQQVKLSSDAEERLKQLGYK